MREVCVMNRKYKIFSWLSILGAVVIFVLVNVFMTLLTGKFPLKLDLTSNKIYDISDDSREFLSQYEVDTTIYILASVTGQDDDVRAVLDRYEAANSHIDIKNVDIKNDPSFGLEYVRDGETLDENDIIVVSGDKSRIISAEDLAADTGDGTGIGLDVESKITSALKFVTSDEVFAAYFTQGHGENEFAGAKQALDSENYTVNDINTVVSDIPNDAAVLIIACPKQDFSTAEIAKLDSYLRNGGAVEVYVDSRCPELPELNKYLTANGIEIGEGDIIDKEGMIGQSPNIMFLIDYLKNPSTEKLIEKDGVLVCQPYARPVSEAPAGGGVAVSKYLQTKDGASVVKDREILKTGRFDIALMSTNADTLGRLYVSGTPLLLSYDAKEINSMSFANVEYFTSVTNSMTGAGDTFVVPVKSMAQNSMIMTANTRRALTGIIVILIPALLLCTGLFVFMKRRNM